MGNSSPGSSARPRYARRYCSPTHCLWSTPARRQPRPHETCRTHRSLRLRNDRRTL
jgi:hypothetical protein